MSDKKLLDDMPMFYGGAIKALGNGKIGGYLVSFTSDKERDLHGQYFDEATDFNLEDYPIVGEPVIYHHGYDETLQARRIGTFYKAEKTPAGIWAEAQMKLRDEYDQMVYKLIEDEKLDWSSGAEPASVQVDETGRIARWYVRHGSPTPTPAEPRRKTRISPLKSLYSLMSERSSDEETKANELIIDDTDSTSIEDVKQLESETPNKEHGVTKMTADELRVILTEIMSQLDGATPAMESAGMDALAKADDEFKPDEEENTEQKSVKLQNVVNAGIKAVQAEIAKRKNAVAGLVNKGVSDLRSAPGRSIVYDTGIQTGKPNNTPRVEVGDNLKYAHLSASDMALGYMLLHSNAPKGVRLPATSFVSEEYLKHMAHKAAGTVNRGFKRVEDSVAMKSILPFKANEIDASNIALQGEDWVTDFYGTTLWEKARELRIYDQLLAAGGGMMEQEVPQGAESVYFPLEGSDPVVYNRTQTNSVDATGRPAVNVNINPFSTARIQVTPGEAALATSYTTVLEEDSVIPIAAQVSRQINEKMLETLEQLIINGDTTLTANTNINLIDGTPGTGLSKPYYTVTDGFLKYALVTASGLKRDGGTLDEDDYINTLALLPSRARRKDKLIFVIDPDTELTSMKIAALKTKDVNTMATIENGELTRMWGIPIMTSGFMLKANNAGKVPVAGGTLGRILLIYKPYWGLAWKRRITVEQQYDALSGAWVYVASFRMGMTYRSTDAAAAVTYNLTVA